MNGAPQEKRHSVLITGREKTVVEGVSEVLRCEDTLVAARIEQGELLLHGNGLRLGSFETPRGVLTVEGKIAALEYSERKDHAKNLIARLFR